MYKLVIVDDERIIRSGLCNFINWNDMGFELVNAFVDGSETIQYIKENKVDVILTDIKMIKVSGIELAKYIYENKILTKVVIISGYKDFDYAKKAIEYNVVHYLLKPVDSNEINRVFNELKAELNSEIKKQEQIELERQSYQEMIPIMQQQFFIDIMMGAIKDEKKIQKRIKLLKLDFDSANSKCCIVNVRINDYEEFIKNKWKYEKEKLQTALFNFINVYSDEYKYFILFGNKEKFKIIIIGNVKYSIEIMKEDIQKTLNEIKDSINHLLGLVLAFEFKQMFNSIYELASYNKPLWMDKQILNNDDEPVSYERFDYKKIQQNYKFLIEKINEGNSDDVKNFIDRFFDQISELPIRYIHRIIIELFVLACNKLSNIGINIWNGVNEELDYQRIVNMNQIKDIKRWTQRAVLKLINIKAEQKEESSQQVIEQAVRYIKENYQNDISREDVAEYVYLNASYFSRYFKLQTGETFSDYITKIRMEKAIDLMKEEKYKTYEISEKVGYKSSKYFSRVFKQYTGITPIEYYRNRVKGRKN